MAMCCWRSCFAGLIAELPHPLPELSENRQSHVAVMIRFLVHIGLCECLAMKVHFEHSNINGSGRTERNTLRSTAGAGLRTGGYIAAAAVPRVASLRPVVQRHSNVSVVNTEQLDASSGGTFCGRSGSSCLKLRRESGFSCLASSAGLVSDVIARGRCLVFWGFFLLFS